MANTLDNASLSSFMKFWVFSSKSKLLELNLSSEIEKRKVLIFWFFFWISFETKLNIIFAMNWFLSSLLSPIKHSALFNSGSLYWGSSLVSPGINSVSASSSSEVSNW